MASRKRPRTPETSSSSIDYTIKSSFVTVPWKHVWEFQSVGDALLSAAAGEDAAVDPDPYDCGGFVSQALVTVEQWKHRVAMLPHGVEATAGLAAVLWRDSNNNSQARFSFVSQTELRLAYAGAIVRAVNGLVDTLQQSRTVAMSISQLSVQLGLPNWLVDIRHEATHNQLPSLPVLRMGATTLLDYFRSAYWGPTQDAAMQTEQAIYQALQEYEDKVDQEALKRDKDLPTANNNQNKQQPSESVSTDIADGCADFMGMPSEDEEEDMTGEEEDETNMDTVAESRLGTSINMFALLMDSPKKGKKKSKKDANAGMTSNHRNKATKKSKSKKKPTPTMTALPSLAPTARNVTQGKPLPVLWHCLVTHMIWGRVEESGNKCGVLLQACDQRAKRKYFTLLSMVGRELPGLMQALLIHLIDYVLRCDGEAAKNATVAVSWVGYLLSRRFILASRESSKWTLSRPSDETADRPLLHFDLPVKSLWERCRDCPATATSQRAVVQSLMRVLAQVMAEGEDLSLSAKEPSVVVKDKEETQEVPEPTVGTEELNAPVDQGTTRMAMSLEDMESMLSEPVNPPASEKLSQYDNPGPSPALSPRVTAWTRCKSWEACPIGTLPGYPA